MLNILDLIPCIGRRNETDDEVQEVNEDEFLERCPETPPAPCSSFSQEDHIPSDDDSTDEEERKFSNCILYLIHRAYLRIVTLLLS